LFDAVQEYVGAGLALDVKFNENVAFSFISMMLGGCLIISGGTFY
jgi:hypothetical protein